MQDETIDQSTQKRKKLQMPHVYVILIILLIVTYIATLLIPKGSFVREETAEGFSVVVPNSFSFTDTANLSFFDFLFSIPTGLVQAGELIFGGIMIGGLFAIIERTGLMNIIIQSIVKLLRGHRILVIPALMIPMALFTTITGAFEMALIYIPALIPLVLRLGYDRFTAFAIIMVSCSAGFSASLTAPATVGLAQKLSELPLYSGILYRSIILVIILLIGIWYVWRYVKKVERDPSLSYVHNDGNDHWFLENEAVVKHVSKAQIIALIVLFVGLGVMVYGLLAWGWYFIEIGGWYAFLGVVIGLICGISPSKIAETFNEGFKMFIVAVIVIGLARAISVVLQDGQILDTVIHALSILINGVPPTIAAVLMLVVQMLFNFLVGSGSGQALITMPIMVGLADLLNVSRQVSVLAFQFGDGFSNMIYPTGLIMAFLAVARIPFGKWLKFIFPLIIIWYIISAIALVVGQIIGWT